MEHCKMQQVLFASLRFILGRANSACHPFFMFLYTSVNCWMTKISWHDLTSFPLESLGLIYLSVNVPSQPLCHTCQPQTINPVMSWGFTNMVDMESNLCVLFTNFRPLPLWWVDDVQTWWIWKALHQQDEFVGDVNVNYTKQAHTYGMPKSILHPSRYPNWFQIL